MFIAHLPAGYLSAHYLHPRFAATGVARKLFVWAALIGSVAPDLDLFYFYLVDHRRTPHHLYWPHFPLVWALALAACGMWLYLARRKAPAALAMVFCIGAAGHILLDTIVGEIYWRAPFAWEPTALFSVPSLYHPWWLNFFLHWSFAFEIALLAWALALARTTRKRS